MKLPFPFLFAFLLPLSAFADAENVAIERDVEYGRAGKSPLKLDILKPAKADEKDKEKHRAAIIYVHGGAWKYGDKSEGIELLKPLVASGDYVGFTIDYRLAGVAPWPAQLHDCKAAVRFVRANAKKFRVDPDRIGVWGTSAGGHLVNMLGVTCEEKEFEGDSGTPGVSSKVRCVVNNCGPTDLPNSNFTDPEDWAILKEMLGDTLKARPDLYKSASPIYQLEKGPEARGQGPGTNDSSPRPLEEGPGVRAADNKQDETTKTEDPSPKPKDPNAKIEYPSPQSLAPNPSRYPAFLHLHGTKDPIVNYETQAVAFHKALKKAGLNSLLIPVEGCGHPAAAPELPARTRAFFDKYLFDKKVEVSEEPVSVKGSKSE